MEKIGVAILGCGRMGNRHATSYSKNKNVKIRGFYDINEKSAKSLAEKFNSSYFTDVNLILENSEINAVSICTPNSLHYDPLISSIKKEKHVIVEKPIVTSIEECDSIIRIMKRSASKVMVGHTHRFYPCNIELKTIFKSRKIGRIKVVNNFDYIPGRNPWNKMPSWVKDKKFSGGGVLMTDFIHTLDKLSWLLESRIKMVYSPFISNFITKSMVEDVAVVNLWFDNGTIATCVCGCPSPGSIDSSVKAIGTKGEVQMEFAGNLHILTDKKYPRKYPHQGDYEKHSSYAFDSEINEFINSIIYDREPQITYKDGITAVKVIKKIYDSFQKKQPMKIPRDH